MTATEEEGFNFGSMSDLLGGVGYDDDCAIDADSFFEILNEGIDNSVPLPTDPFYPSTDNNQECGSSGHGCSHENLPLHQDCGVLSENSGETVEAQQQFAFRSPAESLFAEFNGTSSMSKSGIHSQFCQMPNFVEPNYVQSTQDWFSELNSSSGYPNQNLFDGANYNLMLTNGQVMGNMSSDVDDSQPSPWLENNRALEVQVGDANMTASVAPVYDFFDGQEPESVLLGSHSANTYDSSSSSTTDETSVDPLLRGLMDKSCEKQAAVEINNELLNNFECKSSEANKEGPFHGCSFGSKAGNFSASTEAHYSTGTPGCPPAHYHIPTIDRKPAKLRPWEKPLSSANTVRTFGNLSLKKEEVEEKLVQLMSVKAGTFKVTEKASQTSLSRGGGEEEDDDLCIIEDMSRPGHTCTPSNHGKSLPQRSAFIPQCSPIVTHVHHMGASGTRLKANDERLIFQALVQDLSQPKSEATPPDGCLAVPLLRHQRIALSWMQQKETSSLHCSGGILADDQGLGKTVSTIALILMERSPSSRTSKRADIGKLETLDLDEDDGNKTGNRISLNGLGTSIPRERPSGGTLIVCPTSVLRQWAEELHNKVTENANLSVLVYHGGNRTKDPCEVAKFDVVLTTYSIVSMEVPKQPVVVKDGTDKLNHDADDAPILSSKKRKHPSSSDKKRSKRAMDNELLESAARPLAKVRWFRVVLDEAQSIKNFRTQVAQACWGLRAKRRWCLSGTPIQNAVDDLYSYFRFLKYDPYSVYKSFCSMVKFPISRNPSSGYRKLQAVLKTIMLRRTKGTLLDGKPIITLPPKSVKLEKVEFSEEERDFYSRLEADSRAQFQAYAASGTVQQNYVNILLLLLRLRQACDHPLLVKGFDSGSVLKSSIHMAKKLTQEQQTILLNCLEASLAICHICNDPPEDAVVSICGHVFCNQCISERLSGDDYQCPAPNCKRQLNVSSVFSRATLKSCLSDQISQDGTHIYSASESSDQRELAEARPPGHFDSSKLKAALEVLKSLSKPQVSLSNDAFMKPVATSASPLDEQNTVPSGPEIKSSDASNRLGNASSTVKEKAIVFSQWTRMLDLLETCLKDSSIQYRRLDGTMSVLARDKAVKDFNTLPEVSVMIMSLKAASLGLNMVAACHVLLLDLWWNPTTEDQAIDRAHRIGQTRPVTVVRLTVKDTVEDRILALQQRKRELVASAFGEDETGSRQTRLTVDDLKYLFMA